MENFEIILFLIPAISGTLYGLHLLYFVYAIRKSSSDHDQVQVNAIIAKLFRRHSTLAIREELYGVCKKHKLVDWFLYGRWLWVLPALVAVLILIFLD